MDKPTNIDLLIRDKFEHFSPAPPQHIWEGVKGGIATQATPGFFSGNGRKIAVAAVILLLISLGLWMILPSGNTSDDLDEITYITDDANSQNSGDVAEDANQTNDQKAVAPITDLESKDTDLVNETEQQNQSEIGDDKVTYANENKSTLAPVEESATQTNIVTQEEFIIDENADAKPFEKALAINGLNSLNSELENETEASLIEMQSTEVSQINIPKDKPSINSWSHGIYISPEFSLNDFDSIRILPSYTLSYEPTYRFNKHWFMRFGAGLNYARERGFAKLDYISNEVVGTYEDVYDVTFDTIGGSLVPTYHTKTTEVWDSIRHVQVKEVTNKYLYLQTPLLFGYYNNNSSKFNWYFYGGPAFNVMIGKWIENPENEIGDAEIVNLENNLPNRSPFYMQLWVGAGIEFKIGKQLAFALEPNYRYYFSHVYDDPGFNTSLSGFSLRFGLVFTIK